MVLSSAIVCDHDRRIAEVCFHMIADDRRPYCDLRSAIRDHMETSLYVLSSAIVCDRDGRIADDRRSMFPYDRRRSQTIVDLIAICDLRSAIIWKPALRDIHPTASFAEYFFSQRLFKPLKWDLIVKKKKKTRDIF